MESRPEGLTGSVTIQEVEVEVRYSPYPAGLDGYGSSPMSLRMLA